MPSEGKYQVTFNDKPETRTLGFVIHEGPVEFEENAVVVGYIRSDGCVHWTAEEDQHFCEPADADALAAAFREVWEKAPTLLEGYDAE